MSRRARHNSNDLRELFIDSTTGLISEHGLSAVSARTIARKIGYTAGSLYNVFQDLDDLLLLTEGRQLDRMLEELKSAVASEEGDERVLASAKLYLDFCLKNSRLWNLVVVHQTGANKGLPAWYSEKLEGLVSIFDDALAHVLSDAGQRAHHAHALWACVHGVAALIISGKAPNLNADMAGPMLETVVSSYLKGIKAEARQRDAKKSAAAEHGHVAHGG